MVFTFFLTAFVSYHILGDNKLDSSNLQTQEQRVIKCQLPLAEKLVQNVFYVADDIVTAKKELFNSKKGLFFEGQMYVKTEDYKGNEYVVPFSSIECDSVGYEVSHQFQGKDQANVL